MNGPRVLSRLPSTFILNPARSSLPGGLVAPARFDEIGEAAEVERAVDLLMTLAGGAHVVQLIGPKESPREAFRAGTRGPGGRWASYEDKLFD